MADMRQPRIEKVTVNIGVGEGGERLRKAEQVLEELTKQKPVLTISKTINKEWGIRKGMPIGVKTTLRGERAEDFLKRALGTRNNKIADWSFDEQGHVAFGIPDHTEFQEMKYDPNIGVFGMDICITMERPGYRIKKRRIQSKRIPRRHRLTAKDTMQFLQEKFNVEVV
ncbi:MAG: 50S ribosomal protein L5 [Candidatus Thermoplasmatota archaeon]|nr:50S ribosomal protein L5 [Candidatus Thermoplasmatota archaeon]MDD5778093.1 50S ribosomal protein L5 [Candidatus Thermoplasmatota archaeon]